MAKEVLVGDALSDQMLESGRKLLERLDQINSQITSAFWLYEDELRIWKLILASESVATIGPRKLYEKILVANTFAEETENTLSLNDIYLMSSDQKLVQSLAMMFKTDTKITGIRCTRNYINGMYIEDVYIYRSVPVVECLV